MNLSEENSPDFLPTDYYFQMQSLKIFIYLKNPRMGKATLTQKNKTEMIHTSSIKNESMVTLRILQH